MYHTVGYRNQENPDKQVDYEIVHKITEPGMYLMQHDIISERIKDRMDGVLDSEGEDYKTLGRLDHVTTLIYTGKSYFVVDTIDEEYDTLPNKYEIKHFDSLVKKGLVKKTFYRLTKRAMRNTRDLSDIRKIVIHHTAVKQSKQRNADKMIQSMSRTHKERIGQPADENGSTIAYHYYIHSDGSVRKTRKINAIGYANSNRGVNKEAINIVLHGWFDEDRKPKPQQYEALRQLLGEIQSGFSRELTIH